MKSAREGPSSLFLSVFKIFLILAFLYPFSLSAADINPPLKGFCITAGNYPLPAIWIDFLLIPYNQKISQVIHGKEPNY
jgi:hypothetical protein